MLHTVGIFLSQTFGKQFFLQYFFSKGLDKFGNTIGKRHSKAGLKELFEETYRCLCEENGWEYDIDAVFDSLEKNVLGIDKLNDMEYVNNFLCEILGKDYQDYYEADIAEQWYQCLCRCMQEPRFEKVRETFQFKKIEDLEDKFENFTSSEEAWRKREAEERKEKRAEKQKRDQEFQQKLEFELAEQALDAGEYQEAVEGFRKASIWNTDEHIKYMCLYNEAYCYGKLARDANGYQKAIRFFQKAEKLADASRDDVVLLYRNTGILFIYLGEEQNKVLNYKKANEYLEKILECAGEEDEYYVVDVILHIARNYMDMCDELPLDEVRGSLYLALNLMMEVYLVRGDTLSEEHAYILLHNMGRVFFHLAEKEEMPQLFKQARELYREVLGMNFVKRDNERLAMANLNIGMAYQCDSSEETKNLNKALAYYQIALDLYQSSEKKSTQPVWNVRLNMAEVCGRLYAVTREGKWFEKAEKQLKDMQDKVNAAPGNSLYLRVNLSLMKLYCSRLSYAEGEAESERYLEEAETVSCKIAVILETADYKKYQYTYQILKSRLGLYRIDETTDIQMLINEKEGLRQLGEHVRDGNEHLYQAAEQMAKEYEKAIAWVLEHNSGQVFQTEK